MAGPAVPPRGWSRRRIVDPHAKFVYLLLSSFALVAVYVFLSSTLGSWAGALSAGPLLLVVTGCAVRTFRDPDVEPYEAPREWWRMTARPASGFVVGSLFVAQAAWVAVRAPDEPDSWALLVGAATEAFLGVMFLRSSLRLRAGLTRRPRG